MAFDLKGRKISMFRCHLDPSIGPKPKNAFTKKDMPNAYFELTPIGVYVKIIYQVPGNALQESEHLVPYANVQSIKLEPVEPMNEKELAAVAKLKVA